MLGLLTLVTALSIMAEVLCDATTINARICNEKYEENKVAELCHAANINVTACDVKYEGDNIVLDIHMRVSAKLNPGLNNLGEKPTSPAKSCQQINELKPNSNSGFYWIQVGNSSSHVYCDMNMRECGGGSGPGLLISI